MTTQKKETSTHILLHDYTENQKFTSIIQKAYKVSDDEKNIPNNFNLTLSNPQHPKNLQDEYLQAGDESFNPPDVLHTYNRVLGQVGSNLTRENIPDNFTSFASQNPKTAAPLIGIGNIGLGTFGFVLSELQNIANERNTDLTKMFAIFRKELDDILKNETLYNPDKIGKITTWFEKYNKYLTEIAENNENFKNLKLVFQNNQLCLKVTSSLSKEKQKEEKKSLLKEYWENAKTYAERLWYFGYITPLAYWIIWSSATLATGVIGVGIASSFGLAVAFGFAAPITFSAIYLTLITVDFLKTRIKNSSVWNGFYQLFFNQTKFSKSDNIFIRVGSAFLNFGRYLLGTLAFIPAMMFVSIEKAYKYLTKKPILSITEPLLNKSDPTLSNEGYDLESPFANGIRDVFRKLAITNQYHEHGINNDHSLINDPTDKKHEEFQPTVNSFWKLPNLYLRTALKFIPFLASFLFSGCFIAWFAIDSAALFGVTISAAVLWPVGVFILSAVLAAGVIKTIEFYHATKENYQTLESANKSLAHIQERENELNSLQQNFHQKIERSLLPIVEKEKLKKQALELPDYKKSGIFEDIENTQNTKPLFSRIRFWILTAVSLGSGALFFRLLGVMGTANGILPYNSLLLTSLKVGAWFGVGAATGGVILFAMIVASALIFAGIKYAANYYDRQHNEVKSFVEQQDVRSFALEKQIGFYKTKLAQIEKPNSQSTDSHGHQSVADDKQKNSPTNTNTPGFWKEKSNETTLITSSKTSQDNESFPISTEILVSPT